MKVADLSTVSTAADSVGNLGPSDILFQRKTPDALTFPNFNDQEVNAQPPRYIAGHRLPIMVLRYSLGQTPDASHYWRDFNLATWDRNEHSPPDLTQTLASNNEEAGAREFKLISGHLTAATVLPFVLDKPHDDSQYLHEIDPATRGRSPAILHTTDFVRTDNLQALVARTRPSRELKGRPGYVMRVFQERAKDDPRSFPDVTWTLPSNIYTLIQDRLLESSHNKAALWASHPELAERLEYLASLEPNWDGYGSMVIAVAAVSRCTRLLIAIDRHIYSEAGDPFLAPMADGGIELEWDCICGKELMVVIPPEGTPIRFLLTSDSEADSMEESSGDFTEDSVVNTLLESIVS